MKMAIKFAPLIAFVTIISTFMNTVVNHPSIANAVRFLFSFNKLLIFKLFLIHKLNRLKKTADRMGRE